MIRKANKDDAKDIAELIKRGWKMAYKGLINDDFLNNISIDIMEKKWEDNILSQNKYNYIYLYEEDTKILGVIRFGVPDDKDDKIHNAEIHVLYVEPILKRHGIGSKLFNYAKEYFINNKRQNLIIWCLKGNKPSIKFYEKMGGINISERKAVINNIELEEIGMEYNLKDSIKLVNPTKEYENQLIEYKKEHLENGEKVIHACSKWDKMDNYNEWLELLKSHSSFETIKDNWTVHSNFLGIRESDNKVIGMIDIRHELTNDFLKNYAGHIGYSVRPSERKKGYATQMLDEALEFCRDSLKLNKVMISCDKYNLGSRKTIINAGGILEREFIAKDGENVQVYWIRL